MIYLCTLPVLSVFVMAVGLLACQIASTPAAGLPQPLAWHQSKIVYSLNVSRSHAPAWEYIPYRFLRWRMGTRRKTTSTKRKSGLKDARFSNFNVP